MILNCCSALLLGHEQNASAGTLRREKSEVKLVDEEEEKEEEHKKKTRRIAIRAAVIGQPLLKTAVNFMIQGSTTSNNEMSNTKHR